MWFRLSAVVLALLCAQQALAINPYQNPGNSLTAGEDLQMATGFYQGIFSNQANRALVPQYFKRDLSTADNKNWSGMAAGDAGTGYSVWGSASFSDIENTEDAIQSDTDAWMLLGGFDTLINERWVVGAAIGYEEVDIKGDPKPSAYTPVGNIETHWEVERDAFTYSFYTGYKISDNWTVDASLGWAPNIMIDQRTFYPAGPVYVMSSSSNDRYSYALNANRYWMFDTWMFEVHMGYLFVDEKQSSYDTFTAGGFSFGRQLPQDTTLGQYNFRGQATWFKGQFEPYLGLSVEHDANEASEDFSVANLSITQADWLEYDKTSIVLNTGFNYYVNNTGSVSFDFSTVAGRDEVTSRTIQLSYRHSF